MADPNRPAIEIGKIPFETRLFINGEFVEPTSDITWDNVNPSDESVICKMREASKSDVDKAVKVARRAFETWRFRDCQERAKIMFAIADLTIKHLDQLAKTETLDNGKPLTVCKAADMKLLADQFRYYAGWCDKLEGSVIPVQSIMADKGNHTFFCYTKKEPIGVVAQVIPWNFPLLMLAWKVAPVLATGCCTVLKTSEKTPLSALQFAYILREAGVPPGVVNIVHGHGPTVGDHLVRHVGIDKVAFTGSCASGQLVKKAAAESGMKAITLELGGKSPLIVLDDADLDKAVNVCHNGLFFNMGQCCIASSRIYVQDTIYDEFVRRILRAVKDTVMCDPFEPTCTQGPQIDKIQYEKILRYIQSGRDEGAQLLCGGDAVPGKGFWINPTIFSDVQQHMTIAQEEIFGPVMCLFKFSTVDEVIEKANDSSYGLGAGVCTRSINRAFYVTNRLHAGTVYINSWVVLDPGAPFGGMKHSGLGRELGRAGLDGYLTTKTVVADITA